MDERTAELRDLFRDVADEDTVTAAQSDDRGSVTGADEATVRERVAAVVGRLRDHHAFRTDLPTADLVTVARRFYDGDDDATIARVIDADPETVFRARLDLLLLTEDDADCEVPLAAVRDADADAETLAADLDATPEAVERARHVAEARATVRRTSHRFQSAFEDAIPDAALSVTLTEGVRDDGLGEAAEDIETNTKF